MALARRSRRILLPSCFSHGERVLGFGTHDLSEISLLTDTAYAPQYRLVFMGNVENHSIMGWVQGIQPANSLTTGRPRILIVEDDVPLAQILVLLLMRCECEVQSVHTGKAGMQLAQEIRFDLIVLDIDLPDVTGFDVCKELKQRHFTCKTPIVFTSGRPTEGNAEHAFKLGAADFIQKPFGIEFAQRLLSNIKMKGTGEKGVFEARL